MDETTERRDDVVNNDVDDRIPSSEEEGEDVFDSSEEDDNLDEDEDEARKIKEGFIVDDEDGDNDDEDEEGTISKKRRKHKRRNREDEDDRLSEDDLDLLMENAGVKRSTTSTSGRLKRLKRGEGEKDESTENDRTQQKPSSTSQLDNMFEDIDEDEAESRGRRGSESEMEEGDESHNDSGIGRRGTMKTGIMDELDDFIEEDEFSDEDEETRERRLEERRLQKQQRMNAPQQISGLSSDKIDEMYDIFGDGHDYDWALEIENDEINENNVAGTEEGEELDESGLPVQTKKTTDLQDIYDLEDLKQNLLTEEDMVIRKADIPERFQELRKGIQEYGTLSEQDQELEKKWITDKIAVSKNFDAEYDMTEFKEAIGSAVRFITHDNLEVPFIYAYRRNYISSRVSGGFILSEDDLWEIVTLDLEFQSIISKRNYVKKFYEELNIHDSNIEEYFEGENSASTAELNALQDIHDFMEFKYSQEINKSISSHIEQTGKRHLKNSSYEKFKNSPLYEAVKEIGITAENVGENFSSLHQINSAVDHASMKPQEVIESVVERHPAELQIFSTNMNLALETVRKYYSLELSKNIKIREKVRADFYKYYLIDVVLTKKGKNEIQRGSLYEDIKYAINRTPLHFRREPNTFLRMLEAESLNLMTLKIHMSSQDQYINHLFQIVLETTNTSELASEWNNFRKSAFKEAMNQIFMDISSEIKEGLTKTCQKLVALTVRHKFMSKLDQAPYIPNAKDSKIPRILTLSCGQGKFGADAIIAVFVNRKGEFVKDFKIVDNPFDRSRPEAFEDTLENVISTCQPNAIGINGPNPKTEKFFKKVQEIIQRKQIVDNKGHLVSVIYVEDETALRFQSSKRAQEEFSNKAPLIKYCIGLARYMHSPLLEYANLLPEELKSLAIHPHQSLLPAEILAKSLESAFVDIVNLVGVDVNKSTDNDYYATLLKYVSGFGKRKAADFLQSLHRLNEPLLARQQLITHNILHKTIFMNSAGFLNISWNEKRQKYEDLEHDQLDSTRIHPEDYHLATKVAADALEYDPDAITEKEDQGTMSDFIEYLRDDPDRRTKLESLNLESYAEELEKKTGQRKLNNLSTIVLELLDGFEELRNDFHPLQGEEIFQSLTGETEKTFFKGCVIPVKIERFWHNDIKCITNSGVDCVVNAQRHAGAQYQRAASEIYEIGKTYPAKIIFIDYSEISAEVSLLEDDVEHEYIPITYSKDPSVWDLQQELKDKEEEKRISAERARAKRAHRVLNHPYYFPFNSKQAEDYLRTKNRGDFVIRQSSRGDDHLVITWKLDKDLFEHIDIKELDKENPLALGKTLVVDNQRYHDLDQLIVEYLQNKVRLLNEMTSNEKFKPGNSKEVIKFIEDYSKVNPQKSVYYFSFNYEHPGWFFINFKINASGKLYTWNVRLTNTGFYLVNYNYPSVVQLCNGFKTLLKSNRNRS